MSIPWPDTSHHHVVGVVKVLTLFVSPLAFVVLSKHFAFLTRLFAVKPKPVSRARLWKINNDSENDEVVLKTEQMFDANPVDHEVFLDDLYDIDSHLIVGKNLEVNQGGLGADSAYCTCGASTDALDWISPTVQERIGGDCRLFFHKEHRSRSAGGKTRLIKEHTKPFSELLRNPEPDSNKNSCGHAIHSDEQSHSPVSEIVLRTADGEYQESGNQPINMSLAKVQYTIETTDMCMSKNGFCRQSSNPPMQVVGRANEARQSSEDGGANPGLMEVERCASSDYSNHSVVATRKPPHVNDTTAKENDSILEYLPNSPCIPASKSLNQTPCKTTLKESEVKSMKNQQKVELERRGGEKLIRCAPIERAKRVKRAELCSQDLWEDTGLSDVKDKEDEAGPVPHARRWRRCKSAEDHCSTQPAVSNVAHESCAEPHQVPSNSSSCDSYSTAPCSSFVSSESGLEQPRNPSSSPTDRDFREDNAPESRANVQHVAEQKASSPQLFQLATPPRFLPRTWCKHINCQRKMQRHEKEDGELVHRENSGTVPLFELMTSTMRTWFPSLYKGCQMNFEHAASEKVSQPNVENDQFQNYDIRNVFGPQNLWSSSPDSCLMERAKACPHSCVSSFCNFRGTVERWKKELLLTQSALSAPAPKVTLPCSFCHEDYQCRSPMHCYLQRVVRELWGAVFEFKRSHLESVECPYVRQHSSEQLLENTEPESEECSLGHKHSCNRDYTGCSQLSMNTVSEESLETPCAHVLMHEIDFLLQRLKRLKQATEHKVYKADGVQPQNFHQNEDRQRENQRHTKFSNNHNKTTNFSHQPLLVGMSGSKQDNSLPKMYREEKIQRRREEDDDSHPHHDVTIQLSDRSSTSSEDAGCDTKYSEGTASEKSEGLDDDSDGHGGGHPGPTSISASASMANQLAELEAVTEMLLNRPGLLQNDDAGHEVRGNDSLPASILSSVNEMIPRESTEIGLMSSSNSPFARHQEAYALRRQLSELRRICQPSSSAERHAQTWEERSELPEGRARTLGKLAQRFLEHIEHSLRNSGDTLPDSTRGSVKPTCEGDSPQSGQCTTIGDVSFSSYAQSEKDPQVLQNKHNAGTIYKPPSPSSSQTLHNTGEQKLKPAAVVTDGSSPGISLVSAFQNILFELDGLRQYKEKNECDRRVDPAVCPNQFQLHELGTNGNIGQRLEDHHVGRNSVDQTICMDKPFTVDGYNIVERTVGEKIHMDPPTTSGSDQQTTVGKRGGNVEESELQQTDPNVISTFNELIKDLNQLQLRKSIAESSTENYAKRKNIKNVKFDSAVVQTMNPSVEAPLPCMNSPPGPVTRLEAPSCSFPHTPIADCTDDLCVEDISVSEAFDQLDKIVDDLLKFMDIHEAVK